MAAEHDGSSRPRAFAALAAILPAPTLGLVAALHVWPEQPLGQIVFALCKVWLVALPLVWLVLVERRRPHVPRLRAAGMAAGFGTGVAIFAGICLVAAQL